VIDTNTVNYAMNKITATIGAMAPTIQNVSESYVRFVVSQQIAYLIGFVVTGFLSLLIWLPIYKMAKKKENGYNNFDEAWFIVPTVCLSIVFIVCFIGAISQSIDTFLAVSNPEMFTINSLIENAKNHKN
jgi:hypothetical protein